MKKRAQIQLMETIAVIFVFFILVMIGFMFYARIARTNIQSSIDDQSELKSIEIAQRVMFLPEIQCSEGAVSEIQNCVDKLKLESAQDIIKYNEIYYYDMLEFSSINVTQIYPEKATWQIYSRQTTDFRSRFETNIPVSIFDPLTKKNSFGLITLETQTK
jgi:hypothetical protein